MQGYRNCSEILKNTSKLWAPEGEMKYSVHSEPTNSTRHNTKFGRAGDPALWICTPLDARCYISVNLLSATGD